MEGKIRESVKEFYGSIAQNIKMESACGCSVPKGGALAEPFYGKIDLDQLPAMALEASLGCANPLLFAGLKEGETVLDLGSGGGLDVLAATKYVGPSGKVYGLDMTDEMLALARQNQADMGVINVEFLKGYIEEIPLNDESVDAIISNCVINLSEDKEKALAEAYRVLRNGGRLAIADIVTLKEIPDKVREIAAMWSSCLGGTLAVAEYEDILKKVGFSKVEVEVAQVYTTDFISGLAGCSCFEPLVKEFDLDIIDGAFAGAYIKAVK